MSLGSGMIAGFAVVAGTEALTACSCVADGFAVWASAVKSEEELEPTCHAAPAKKRQEIPVAMRTDERRKRSSAKTLIRCDIRRGVCGLLVTGGVTRLALSFQLSAVSCQFSDLSSRGSELSGFVLGAARLRLCGTGEGA